MAKKNTANSQDENQNQIELYANPELAYVYHDLFNIFAGRDEVVIELGNQHRAARNRASLGYRAVLSLPNAVQLMNGLQQAISQAQQQMQQEQNTEE